MILARTIDEPVLRIEYGNRFRHGVERLEKRIQLGLVADFTVHHFIQSREPINHPGSKV